MAQNPGLKTPSAGITIQYSKPKPQQMYNTGNVPSQNVNPRYIPNALPSTTPQSAYMGGSVQPTQYRPMINYNYAQQPNGPSFTNVARPIQFGNIMEAGNVGVYNQYQMGRTGAAPVTNYMQGEKGYNPLQFNYVQPASSAVPTFQAGQRDAYGRVALDNTGLAWRNPGISGDKWRVTYVNGEKVTTYAKTGWRGQQARGGSGPKPVGPTQSGSNSNILNGSDWTVSTG